MPFAMPLPRPLPRPFTGPFAGPLTMPFAMPLPRPLPGPLPGPFAGPFTMPFARPLPGAGIVISADSCGWGGYWYWGGAVTSFFRDVCGLDLPGDLWDRARALEATMQSACWWWPHREFVMVCERPTVIHRECVDPRITRGPGSHRLHCETGPAIAWPDGWGVYALHGVRVPAWIVETPADRIDPRRLLQETNAEIRRELVRKVGIERVCETLGATLLDRQGDYELLALDLQDGRHRPYLKMKNPSIGVYHLEGVHPNCATVQQALNWRAYGDATRAWKPVELT